MSKRIIIVIAIIVTAVFLVGGSVMLVNNHRKAEAPKPAVVDQKKNAPAQTPTQAAGNNKPSQDVPVSPTLSVSDIRATEKGSTVSATAAVGGSKDASGTCVFTFSNDLAKPVVRQVTPSGAPGNLICDTGAINNVEFSVVGEWKLTVNYFNNNERATGSSAVTIN